MTVSRKPRLLADRVDQQRPLGRQRRGQRQSGISAAGPEVEEPIDAVLPKDLDGREAVDDVRGRDRLRIADGRQVDRARPRQEQARVTFDRLPGVRLEPKVERLEAGVERTGRRRREGWEVLDARRERLTPRVQGTPPDVCVPSVLAWRHSRRRHRVARGLGIGLPPSVRFPAESPRAPRGSRYPARPSADVGRYAPRRMTVYRVIHELPGATWIRG